MTTQNQAEVIVFPKLQVKAVFQTKGEAAARKLATKLGIDDHRANRWIDIEWLALAQDAASAAAKNASIMKLIEQAIAARRETRTE